MKQALKEILPRPILNAVNRIRAIGDTHALAALPAASFELGNLRSMVPGAIAALLAAPQPHWESDHKSIAAVIGDDDRAGGVNPGDRRALYTLIAVLKPQSVLEIGTHIGASTQYIASALTRCGSGSVTTVDIHDVNDPVRGAWRAAGLQQPPRICAQKIGNAGRISFVTEPSLTYMLETTARFDFIFLDGDHRAVSVYSEVAAALRLLNPGGLILLHDFYPNGMPLYSDGSIIAGPYRALSRIMREAPDLSILPLGVLPWSTKLGSRVTSLALAVLAV